MCDCNECKQCRARMATEIHRLILIREKELPEEIISLLKAIYVILRTD